jgi:hypothetical protein
MLFYLRRQPIEFSVDLADVRSERIGRFLDRAEERALLTPALRK